MMKFLVSFLLFSLTAVGAVSAQSSPDKVEVAIFAGGCFWCVESDFDKIPGVISTVSGYTGGTSKNPTYTDVTAGGTGHREAVRIEFDPSKTTYEELLHYFWRTVDPTDGGGQFCDRGRSYETAIFVTNDTQRAAAEKSKMELRNSGVLTAEIVTPIETASTFYPAEDYHQDYYQKNPVRYKLYRYGCGRDKQIEKIWGKEAHGGHSQSSAKQSPLLGWTLSENPAE